MCGKDSELFKAVVEGVELTVCEKCASFGKILRRIKIEEKKPKITIQKQHVLKEEKEVIETVVEDYADRIKRKREKLGLKQEELAQKIAEKESIIHKIENSKMVPPIKLARKLQKFLEIKLIEEEEAEDDSITPKGTGGDFTIGDMIKVKK
jgi:putative transcription factor